MISWPLIGSISSRLQRLSSACALTQGWHTIVTSQAGLGVEVANMLVAPGIALQRAQ